MFLGVGEFRDERLSDFLGRIGVEADGDSDGISGMRKV